MLGIASKDHTISFRQLPKRRRQQHEIFYKASKLPLFYKISFIMRGFAILKLLRVDRFDLLVSLSSVSVCCVVSHRSRHSGFHIELSMSRRENICVEGLKRKYNGCQRFIDSKLLGLLMDLENLHDVKGVHLKSSISTDSFQGQDSPSHGN